MLAPPRVAVHVVVIKRVRDFAGDALAQRWPIRQAGERQPDRPRGRRRDRERECPVAWRQRADQQSGRPAERRQRNLPECRAPHESLRRQIDPAKNFARRQHVLFRSGDEIHDRNLPLAAVARPDRADAIERGGQRDHRAAGGSDMQMLPPTVAVFQILNEARNARQHWPIRGAAVHSTGSDADSSAAIVQVAAIRRPVRSSRWRPVEAAEIDQAVQMRLRLREQPGATASQASPSASAATGRRRAADHLLDRVQVHDSFKSLRSVGPIRTSGCKTDAKHGPALAGAPAGPGPGIAGKVGARRWPEAGFDQ